MGLFQRLAGLVNNFFQLGGPGGAALKNDALTGPALEVRNPADLAYAIMRGATPVGDDDFTTKRYVDTTTRVFPVALQFNGSSALPPNSATEQFYVVTTTGINAAIGDILWDDGTGVGTVTVLVALPGRMIGTEVAFTGGTVTLQANSIYMWTGTAWVNVSPSVSGAVFEIRMPITTAASQSSATSIPANAVVSSAELDVRTAYSSGTTLKIGQTGTLNLLQDTGDNFPTVQNLYRAPQDTAWGASALPVLVTITGAPSVGSGFVIVRYSVPNA